MFLHSIDSVSKKFAMTAYNKYYWRLVPLLVLGLQVAIAWAPRLTISHNHGDQVHCVAPTRSSRLLPLRNNDCWTNRHATLKHSGLPPIRTQIMMANDDDNKDETNTNDEKDEVSNKNYSKNSQPSQQHKNKGRIGPLGGRRKKRTKSFSKDSGNSNQPMLFKNCWSIPALLLGLIIIKGILFGGGGGGGSTFVYYESSVYETRVYNNELGKVETSRKESFRSNIPSLVEQRQQKQQQQKPDGGQSQVLF